MQINNNEERIERIGGGLAASDPTSLRTRRQVLAGAAGTAAAIALTCLGCGNHKDANAPESAAGGAAPAGSTPPHNLGKVADFPQEGPPKFINVPTSDDPAKKLTFVVDNVGDGKFRVLIPTCTHKGCTVAWNKAAGQFICPCHGGHFDRTGKNVGGPPPRPLSEIPARVENGNVMIG